MYLLDIFPTLCDILGLETPASVEGESFVEAIRDPTANARETLYFAFNDKIRSVKNDRYKLIEYVHDGCASTALYDLRDDPWELANLASSSANRGIVEEMRNELFRSRDDWEDERHRLGRAFWDGYRSAR